jgi:hypothetical protein
MVVTNIVFDPATALRKRILIVEEDHDGTINLPPFRLRLGHGMEYYVLTHELPSVFSRNQLSSEGPTADWGLLHLINSDSQGFFIVWVIISQPERLIALHTVGKRLGEGSIPGMRTSGCIPSTRLTMLENWPRDYGRRPETA